VAGARSLQSGCDHVPVHAVRNVRRAREPVWRHAARGAVILALALVPLLDVSADFSMAPAAAHSQAAAAAPATHLCPVPAAPGPPRGEPFLRPGPTTLISGLYLVGGPLVRRAAPRCSSIVGTPSGGTITVTDRRTGVTVARAIVRGGKLAKIGLRAGTYTITGTFAHAFSNGHHIRAIPRTVRIPAGRTVRQDLIANIR
jgi:hypothetical protein